MELNDWKTYILPFGMLMLVLSQTTTEFANFEILALTFYWFFVFHGFLGFFIAPQSLIAAMDEERRNRYLEDNLFVYPVAIRVISILLLAYYGWNQTAVWFSITSLIVLLKMGQCVDLLKAMREEE